jgi:hypothetical protein
MLRYGTFSLAKLEEAVLDSDIYFCKQNPRRDGSATRRKYGQTMAMNYFMTIDRVKYHGGQI